MKTIQEVMEILGVKNRKTVYDYCSALNVSSQKVKGEGNKTFFDSETVEKLKELKEYLDQGGLMKNYTSAEIVIEVQDSPSNSELVASGNQQLDLFAQLTERIADTVTSRINSTFKSPIAHWRELVYANENKLVLTSREIKAIIGVKPTGAEFKRGAFTFKKDDKIGRETSWRVEKS